MGTPIDTQSPSGVPSTQSRTWSIAALAAEAALEAPRASMIAAPRFATRGMNSSRDPGLVVDRVPGARAAHPGVDEVGVLGGRVVAPHGHVRDLGQRPSDLVRQLRPRPVVVEAHHRREALARHAVGVRHRDQAVGVGRVADHQDPHVVGGAGGDRLALGLEDAAVGLEQVGALHARARAAGRRPAGRRCSRRRRPSGSSKMSTFESSGKAQSSSSIAVPSAALTASGISSRLSSTGVSGPSIWPLAILNSSA